MRDDIRFLQELEADLETVTRTRDERPPVSEERRRTVGRGIWAGAAAAVLAVSFALGSFVQTNGASVPGVLRGDAASTGSAGSVVPAASVGPTTWGADAGHVPAASPGIDQPAGYTVNGAATSFGTRQNSDSGAAAGEASQETAAPGADLSKIVRDGEMAVTIDSGSFREKSTSVVSIAHANGGSVLSSTTSSGTAGTFTLRIPAAHFDKAMVQLSALGSVDSSAVHGQDVTAQYIDQKAHLKIYLTHRTFLYGLMAKATTTGQALALENQLQQVQLRIDQITGQLRYLNNQVAESTIKLDLHEPGAEPLTTDSTPVENPSLGDAFARSVQGFLNVIAVMLIGFGYLIPILVIAGVAYLVVRLVQRRRSADQV
jgi:hypothetical protein